MHFMLKKLYKKTIRLRCLSLLSFCQFLSSPIDCTQQSLSDIRNYICYGTLIPILYIVKSDYGRQIHNIFVHKTMQKVLSFLVCMLAYD